MGYARIIITSFLFLKKEIDIFIMGGDLQHPLEVIPKLIQKWKERFELVYTVRNEIKDTSLFKNLSASIFYSLWRMIHPATHLYYFSRTLDRLLVKNYFGVFYSSHVGFYRSFRRVFTIRLSLIKGPGKQCLSITKNKS